MVVPLPGGRAFAAAGYTGNGVGPSHMVGRTLPRSRSTAATSTRGLPSSTPRPQRVPPEPFHWLGGEAIRRGIVRKEDAETSGPAPDPLSALVARIPELIGFHIGR